MRGCSTRFWGLPKRINITNDVCLPCIVGNIRNAVATPLEYEINAAFSEEPSFPVRKMPGMSFFRYFNWERNIPGLLP